MPELPEVEGYRRYFTRHAADRRIDHVDVLDPVIVRNADIGSFADALAGRRFEQPHRIGKWLLAPAEGPVVLFHFGMTGDLEWGDDAVDRHRHDRAVFVLDDGELRYRNLRKLGGLWLAADATQASEIVGGLGPDALDVARGVFLERLGTRRGMVKPALMDQRLVAGVGNLMADEALWRAHIHPAVRIETLDGPARERLYDSMRAVLRRAVGRRDAAERGMPQLLPVRREDGPGCPRCHSPLGRIVVGGRTTYFCPSCQPTPS